MDDFNYEPLDLIRDRFRLLTLKRGPFYSGVECSLQHVPFGTEATPEYEALSYTWGSGERTDIIQVNGNRMWVTDNLHSALQYLRLPDEDRVIWIDAVCINQGDKDERNQQVAMMSSIYEAAARVIFWLGKPTPEADVLMQTLTNLGDLALKRLFSSGDHDRRAEHDVSQLQSLWTTLQAPSERNGAFQPRDLRIASAGLKILLQRPWFKRMWIIQEVTNAQKAIVCCGRYTIHSGILKAAPSLLAVLPDSQIGNILERMPGLHKRPQAPDYTLFELLHGFKASEATDARDKIYALLGISSDRQQPLFPRANYLHSPLDTVKNVFRYLIDGSSSPSMPQVLDLFVDPVPPFDQVNGVYLVNYDEDYGVARQNGPGEGGERQGFLRPRYRSINFEGLSSDFVSGLLPMHRKASCLFLGQSEVMGGIAQPRADRDKTLYEQCTSMRLHAGSTHDGGEWPRAGSRAWSVFQWRASNSKLILFFILDFEVTLVWACRRGLQHVVETLLGTCTWIGKPTYIATESRSRNMAAIYAAYEAGHHKIVQLLLQRSEAMRLHPQSLDAGSTLLLAVQRSDLEIIKRILNAGIGVNDSYFDPDRNTEGYEVRRTAFEVALVVALDYEESEQFADTTIDVIKLLLSRGATIHGGSAMAPWERHVRSPTRLLDGYDNKDRKLALVDIIAAHTHSGHGCGCGSWLISSIRSERYDIEIPQILLSRGCSPLHFDINGVCMGHPLGEAIRADNLRLITIMLASGADPNAGASSTCVRPRTSVDSWCCEIPLITALRSDNFRYCEIIEALLKAGADIHHRQQPSPYYGDEQELLTPLEYSKVHGHAEGRRIMKEFAKGAEAAQQDTPASTQGFLSRLRMAVRERPRVGHL